MVNNAFLLPGPEKSLLTSWFRSPIKPFSTASHRTLADSVRGYIDYSTTEDPTKIPES